jgi:hypothetical protein
VAQAAGSIRQQGQELGLGSKPRRQVSMDKVWSKYMFC